MTTPSRSSSGDLGDAPAIDDIAEVFVRLPGLRKRFSLVNDKAAMIAQLKSSFIGAGANSTVFLLPDVNEDDFEVVVKVTHDPDAAAIAALARRDVPRGIVPVLDVFELPDPGFYYDDETWFLIVEAPTVSSWELGDICEAEGADEDCIEGIPVQALLEGLVGAGFIAEVYVGLKKKRGGVRAAQRQCGELSCFFAEDLMAGLDWLQEQATLIGDLHDGNLGLLFTGYEDRPLEAVIIDLGQTMMPERAIDVDVAKNPGRWRVRG